MKRQLGQAAGARRRFIVSSSLASIAAGVLGGSVFGSAAIAQSVEPDVTVYKSRTCGCCGAWVDHLKDNGFNVNVVNQRDVVPDKQYFGVPERLYSCHTARVGGYTIEGHVPAQDIKRLLAERPAVSGLAVPGMPQGSPGMETGQVDPYSVLTFTEEGETSVFSSY